MNVLCQYSYEIHIRDDRAYYQETVMVSAPLPSMLNQRFRDAINAKCTHGDYGSRAPHYVTLLSYLPENGASAW